MHDPIHFLISASLRNFQDGPEKAAVSNQKARNVERRGSHLWISGEIHTKEESFREAGLVSREGNDVSIRIRERRYT
jgi:hypothetical protein